MPFCFKRWLNSFPELFVSDFNLKKTGEQNLTEPDLVKYTNEIGRFECLNTIIKF